MFANSMIFVGRRSSVDARRPIVGGRFGSDEPLGFAGKDANLYRYVGNSPVNFTDPWGLSATQPLSSGSYGAIGGGLVSSAGSFLQSTRQSPQLNTTLQYTTPAPAPVTIPARTPSSLPPVSPSAIRIPDNFSASGGYSQNSLVNNLTNSVLDMTAGLPAAPAPTRPAPLYLVPPSPTPINDPVLNVIHGALDSVFGAPDRAVSTYQTMRQQGASIGGSLYVGVGSELGGLVGVESFENAREGRDRLGNQLSTGQRVLQGALAGVQLGTVAVPAARAGTTVAATPARTNAQLIADIAVRAERKIGGTGAAAGSAKHSYAKKVLDRYQGIYGDRGLQTEVSVINGTAYRYGTKGSVRLDVLEGSIRNPTTIYDYKFGEAGLSTSRINQIQGVGGYQGVSIIEVRP